MRSVSVVCRMAGAPVAAALLATALFAVLPLARGQTAAPDRDGSSAPDRVLVQLRPAAPNAAEHSTQTRRAPEWAARLGLPPGVTLRDLRGNAAAAEELDVSRPIVVQLNGKATKADALRHLNSRPDVLFAEPDYVGKGQGAPTDPSYSAQWHHQRIQSEAAWDVSTGGSGVIVAVLDTGLNSALQEFAGRVEPGGHDYVNDDTSPADDHGHGTAVTGILAANANNGIHVAGINWQCRILPMKVLDARNFGYYSWQTAAIYRATDAGARVINFSIGGSSESAAMTAAIEYATSRGVIFVTVAGNDGAGTIQFPGRLPQCITVGATERDDTRASFSNWGLELDLVAPGRDMYTVGREGALEYWYGTSFAAPLVSGLAATIVALDPSITQARMEKLFCATADDRVGGSLDGPGWDFPFGCGRLNAKSAVELGARPQSLPEPVNISSRGLVKLGDNALIGGFIISGTHAKHTLLRAIGPSLRAAGVVGPLENPTLELRDSAGNSLSFNNNWGDSQRAEIEGTGIAPTDSREAAIAAILLPGAYTAIVRGLNNTQGIGVIEAYDLQQTPNSRLANISTRGFVDRADKAMIGGFIVAGFSDYVVRAIGPSLSRDGVADTLENPTLELRDGNGELVAFNNDWASDESASRVQSSGLAPRHSQESAIRRELPAGSYTAVVRGLDDGVGVGLVEIYNVR